MNYVQTFNELKTKIHLTHLPIFVCSISLVYHNMQLLACLDHVHHVLNSLDVVSCVVTIVHVYMIMDLTLSQKWLTVLSHYRG